MDWVFEKMPTGYHFSFFAVFRSFAFPLLACHFRLSAAAESMAQAIFEKKKGEEIFLNHTLMSLI